MIYVRLRVCDRCGLEESVRKDNPATTCGDCNSRSSLAIARAARSAKRLTAKCSGCSAMIFTTPFKTRAANQYCSLSCFRDAKSIVRGCKMCKAAFRIPLSALSGKTNKSGNFCSRACYDEFLGVGLGPKSRGAGWAAARSEALRWNPFCAICGRLRHLHVHHIIPYRVSRDNRQINLIPLCRRHHRQVEHIYLGESFEGRSVDEMLFFRRVDLIERQSITRMVLQEMLHGRAV